MIKIQNKEKLRLEALKIRSSEVKNKTTGYSVVIQ